MPKKKPEPVNPHTDAQCVDAIAKAPNLATAAERLSIPVQVLKAAFQRYIEDHHVTAAARRAVALERIAIGQAALMPAVAAGDNAAMHSLAKLVKAEADLTPDMAAPVAQQVPVVVTLSWLGAARLSYPGGPGDPDPETNRGGEGRLPRPQAPSVSDVEPKAPTAPILALPEPSVQPVAVSWKPAHLDTVAAARADGAARAAKAAAQSAAAYQKRRAKLAAEKAAASIEDLC